MLRTELLQAAIGWMSERPLSPTVGVRWLARLAGMSLRTGGHASNAPSGV